jgi:ankyrin repeat protein
MNIHPKSKLDAKNNNPMFSLRVQTVKLLLDAKANPNMDRYGRTALQMAVSRAFSYELVCILIEARANVNASTPNIPTALHLACLYDREPVCGILLKNGAYPSLTIRDRNGDTPIDVAMRLPDPYLFDTLAVAVISCGMSVRDLARI